MAQLQQMERLIAVRTIRVCSLLAEITLTKNVGSPGISARAIVFRCERLEQWPTPSRRSVMLKHVIVAISIGCAVVALRTVRSPALEQQSHCSRPHDLNKTQSPTPSSPAGQPPQATMAEMMKRHQQMMADI